LITAKVGALPLDAMPLASVAANAHAALRHKAHEQYRPKVSMPQGGNPVTRIIKTSGPQITLKTTA
jgi:hypothetical protein